MPKILITVSKTDLALIKTRAIMAGISVTKFCELAVEAKNQDKTLPIIARKYRCAVCDHEWVPRFRVSAKCPNCQSTYFDPKLPDEINRAKQQKIVRDRREKAKIKKTADLWRKAEKDSPSIKEKEKGPPAGYVEPSYDDYRRRQEFDDIVGASGKNAQELAVALSIPEEKTADFLRMIKDVNIYPKQAMIDHMKKMLAADTNLM